MDVIEGEGLDGEMGEICVSRNGESLQILRSCQWLMPCAYYTQQISRTLLKLSEDNRLANIANDFRKRDCSCKNVTYGIFGPWCRQLKCPRNKGRNTLTSSILPTPVYKDMYSADKGRNTLTSSIAPTSVYTDVYSADKERKANDISPRGALSTSYGFEKDKTSVQVTKRDGQGPQYEFRHFDDVSRYMIEYRKKHTVGQVCQMHDRINKSGFSLPNINAKRYKKICKRSPYRVCLIQSPQVSAPFEASASHFQDSAENEALPVDKHVRACPNLAPVRKKVTVSILKVTENRAQVNNFGKEPSSYDCTTIPPSSNPLFSTSDRTNSNSMLLPRIRTGYSTQQTAGKAKSCGEACNPGLVLWSRTSHLPNQDAVLTFSKKGHPRVLTKIKTYSIVMAAKKRELEHVTDPQDARVVTNARIAKVAMATNEGTEQYMHRNDFKPSKTKVKVVPSCSPLKVMPVHPDNEVVFSCPETKAMPSCLETKAISSCPETKAMPSCLETKAISSCPETKTMSSHSKNKTISSFPEAKVMSSCPEIKVMPSYSKNKNVSSRRETKTRSSCPETKTRSSCPETKTRSSCPETKTRSSCPETKTRSSCPETKTRSSCPETKAMASCPETEAMASCPDSKTISSCPDSKTISSCPESKTISSCLESKVMPLYPSLPPLQFISQNYKHEYDKDRGKPSLEIVKKLDLVSQRQNSMIQREMKREITFTNRKQNYKVSINCPFRR